MRRQFDAITTGKFDRNVLTANELASLLNMPFLTNVGQYSAKMNSEQELDKPDSQSLGRMSIGKKHGDTMKAVTALFESQTVVEIREASSFLCNPRRVAQIATEQCRLEIVLLKLDKLYSCS